MAKASETVQDDFIKTIYLGDSGSGKTGSLVSLLEAGYKLKILDMDKGLKPLLYYAAKKDKKLLENIDSQSFRDEMIANSHSGLAIKGRPKAYVDALKALNVWDDGSIPAEWGHDTIFCLDSLTAFARAAFLWAEGMNPSAKDKRQIYMAAQESVRRVLELLTSDNFKCNVIVLAHIQAVKNEEGALVREQVNSIGSALGPDIPKFFNTMIAASKQGAGEKVKRTIITTPTRTLDLKFPAELDKSLPLETGMATVFKTLSATN